MDVDERHVYLSAARRTIPRRLPAVVARRVIRPGRLAIVALMAAGLVQLLGGVALAAAPMSGTTPDPSDLVRVAQGGKQGYCYWGDLQGPPPSLLTQTSPRLLQYTSERGYGIPMYESDGTTQIGVFRLGGGGGGGSADGSRYEETADAHGTIITTRQSAAGRITITRTELRGATTTNAAASDPSLRRLPKAERPVKWRPITLWFRDVGPKHPELTSKLPTAPAWLVSAMSAAARAAGDPGAAARWTLTFRRAAAPLEGASAPTTDEGKYSVVWIAVLHGDFSDGHSWVYLMLERGSHAVIAQGTSVTRFDTSMFPLQGRTLLH
jgi:hypothetical protein